MLYSAIQVGCSGGKFISKRCILMSPVSARVNTDLNIVIHWCRKSRSWTHPLVSHTVMQQSSVSPLTSTELLKQLHWLPIEWRIRFKLACLVHKILNTGHPPYLTEFLQYHKPSRSTRSSASHLLSVSRHNLSFGARAFHVAAPKILNSIPLHIRQSQTYSSFRRHLKTHYFISAHLAP